MKEIKGFPSHAVRSDDPGIIQVMSKLMLTRTGTTVLKRRRYSRTRRPRRQSAPTVLQRSAHSRASGFSPGQSPTFSDRRPFFDLGILPNIPEYGRARADLYRARSDPIQCRCDSLKANSDYLRATSDMLKLKSDALRSKSEQLSTSKDSNNDDEQKTILAKSEDLRMRANHLRRESDALREKIEIIRKESEPSLQFPDFHAIRGGDQSSSSSAFMHATSPSSGGLCPPTPIPEVDRVTPDPSPTPRSKSPSSQLTSNAFYLQRPSIAVNNGYTLPWPGNVKDTLTPDVTNGNDVKGHTMLKPSGQNSKSLGQI